MKHLFIFLSTAFIVTLGFQSCGSENGNGNGSGSVDENEQISKPATSLNVSISGTIDHETHTQGQSGTVTFNRFPVSVKEFKQVRDQIGGEPHGAVALQIMASEMFRRHNKIGEECIKLNNTQNNISVCISRLKTIFTQRPYQMAVFLKGSSWDNGYNPEKPYTIEVVVMNGKPYDDSSVFQTKVLFLAVVSSGHESSPLPVSVLKTKKPEEKASENGKYFIVWESASITLQCKEKSFEHDFNGLD